MCTNERAREEEKELLNGKFIHTRKMRCTQHTNMQKSHFYSLAPFHLAQSLAVSLLNALVSAECLSTVKLRKKILLHDKTGSQYYIECILKLQLSWNISICFYFCTKSKVVDSLWTSLLLTLTLKHHNWCSSSSNTFEIKN